MPMTFFLNHPIPHSVRIGGERRDATLASFTCRELNPGEAPPTDDMIAAVIKCTRMESGAAPIEADLRKLDLQGGIYDAVQGAFNL